jgi:hypothetical protein
MLVMLESGHALTSKYEVLDPTICSCRPTALVQAEYSLALNLEELRAVSIM